MRQTLRMFILIVGLLGGTAIAAQPALWPPMRPLDTHWQKTLPFGDDVHVKVGDTRVLISTSSHLDAWTWDTGEPAWATDLPLAQPPIVAEGRVFVAAGDEVLGLSELTGRVEWRFPSGPIRTPMTTRAGWLLMADTAGVVTALRSADGSRIWSRSADGPLLHPIAIDGDTLFTVTATTLTAWAIADGTPRWQVAAAGTRGIFAGHRRVFIASGSYLSAYAQRDGRRQWSYAVAMPPISSLTADMLHVYFAGLDNGVRAFRADNGHMIWKRAVASRIVDGLTADAGVVYVPQASGEISMLLARTGRVTSRLSVPATQSLGADRLASNGALDTLRLARLTVSDTSRVLTTFARTTIPLSAGTLSGTVVPLSPPPPPRRP